MCGVSYIIPYMFNKKKEDKMDKTIVVLRRYAYNKDSVPTYQMEKTAKTLEEAMRYKVALELLNSDKGITFVLFNEVGQFDVERIEKVESGATDEVRP